MGRVSKADHVNMFAKDWKCQMFFLPHSSQYFDQKDVAWSAMLRLMQELKTRQKKVLLRIANLSLRGGQHSSSKQWTLYVIEKAVNHFQTAIECSSSNLDDGSSQTTADTKKVSVVTGGREIDMMDVPSGWMTMRRTQQSLERVR